jgi:hypothetical protein
MNRYPLYRRLGRPQGRSGRVLKISPPPGFDPRTVQHRPLRFQEVEAPRFVDNRHMKVVRLSALRTGRLYPPGKIPGTHCCSRLSQPQGHSATETIMSIKNSSDIIGNRTRDVPACIAVRQQTAPPRASRVVIYLLKISAFNKSLSKTDRPLNMLLFLLMALAAGAPLAEEKLRRLKLTLNKIKSVRFRFVT